MIRSILSTSTFPSRTRARTAASSIQRNKVEHYSALLLPSLPSHHHNQPQTIATFISSFRQFGRKAGNKSFHKPRPPTRKQSKAYHKKRREREFEKYGKHSKGGPGYRAGPTREYVKREYDYYLDAARGKTPLSLEEIARGGKKEKMDSGLVDGNGSIATIGKDEFDRDGDGKPNNGDVEDWMNNEEFDEGDFFSIPSSDGNDDIDMKVKDDQSSKIDYTEYQKLLNEYNLGDALIDDLMGNTAHLTSSFGKGRSDTGQSFKRRYEHIQRLTSSIRNHYVRLESKTSSNIIDAVGRGDTVSSLSTSLSSSSSHNNSTTTPSLPLPLPPTNEDVRLLIKSYRDYKAPKRPGLPSTLRMLVEDLGVSLPSKNNNTKNNHHSNQEEKVGNNDGEDIEEAGRTYATLMTCCASPSEGRRVLRLMMDRGYGTSNNITSSRLNVLRALSVLVDLHSDKSDYRGCRDVIDGMNGLLNEFPDRHRPPPRLSDKNAYENLLRQHELYKKRERLILLASYTSLWKGCRRAIIKGSNAMSIKSEAGAIAWDAWKDMRIKGVNPDVMAYGAMIRILEARGLPEQALDLLDEMTSFEIRPTTLVFTAILRAISRSHSKALRFEGGYSQKNKRREGIAAHHGKMAIQTVILAENSEVRLDRGFLSALAMCCATAGDSSTARAVHLAGIAQEDMKHRRVIGDDNHLAMLRGKGMPELKIPPSPHLLDTPSHISTVVTESNHLLPSTSSPSPSTSFLSAAEERKKRREHQEYGHDTRDLTALLHASSRAIESGGLGNMWSGRNNRGYLCHNSLRFLPIRSKPRYIDKSIPGLSGTEAGLSAIEWDGQEGRGVDDNSTGGIKVGKITKGKGGRLKLPKFKGPKLIEDAGRTVDELDPEMYEMVEEEYLRKNDLIIEATADVDQRFKTDVLDGEDLYYDNTERKFKRKCISGSDDDPITPENNYEMKLENREELKNTPKLDFDSLTQGYEGLKRNSDFKNIIDDDNIRELFRTIDLQSATNKFEEDIDQKGYKKIAHEPLGDKIDTNNELLLFDDDNNEDDIEKNLQEETLFKDLLNEFDPDGNELDLKAHSFGVLNDSNNEDDIEEIFQEETLFNHVLNEFDPEKNDLHLKAHNFGILDDSKNKVVQDTDNKEVNLYETDNNIFHENDRLPNLVYGKGKVSLPKLQLTSTQPSTSLDQNINNELDEFQLLLPGFPKHRLDKLREVFSENLGPPSMLKLIPVLRETMPDYVTNAWLKKKNLRDAHFVMEKAKTDGVVDEYLLNSMLEVLSCSGAIDKTMEFYKAEFKRFGVRQTAFSDRIVLQMFVNHHRIARALDFKDKLELQGKTIDLLAYGSLIEYYGNHGQLGSAMMTLKECIATHGSPPGEKSLSKIRLMCRKQNLEKDIGISEVIGKDPLKWIRHGEENLKREYSKKGRRQVTLTRDTMLQI